MAPNSSSGDFQQLMSKGWVGGYPPWFANFWIKPANCKTDKQKSRLLHLLRAIESGDLKKTRQLLPGFDPDLRLAVEGTKTESLLEWAAEKSRNRHCIRLIVAAGASIKAPNLINKLLYAGQTDLLSEFLKAGADPNGGVKGANPLISACWDYPKAVQLLLDAGARTEVTTTVHITNSRRVSRVTPLMIAAYAGQWQIARLLLDSGVKIEAKDSEGNTAPDWAKISRAKDKAAKIISLLEKAGATADKSASTLPKLVDFTDRAKTPEFRKALDMARKLTKSAGRPVQLAEGPLPGSHSFPIHKRESALKMLEEMRPKAAALGALAVLSENQFEMATPYLVLLPTTDYCQAIIAFETPEGQSIDSYDLIAWLTKLEKTQPFVPTHLAPDLFRARFKTAIRDSRKLAKSIENICSDVINAPLDVVARQLEKSRELYLWWD